MRKILKKNQVIIYVIAVMLMAAGYLNYNVNDNNKILQTSMQMESKDDTQLADIGDATLVNSNDIIGGDTTETNNANITDDVETTENHEKTANDNKIEETSSNTNTNESDYFIKSKLERDNMYSQMIETYEKILNSTNSLETQKQSATEEITKINNTKNSIMVCENLLKTKGFANSVVFVNGDSVSVIVETNDLQQEQVAQIQNIVVRELKAQIENIHIANK